MPYADPERRREYQRLRQIRDAEKISARKKARWSQNADEINAARREAKASRSDEKRAIDSERSALHYQQNKEEKLAYMRDWHQNNKEAKRIYDRTRLYGMSKEEAAAVDDVKFCQATGWELDGNLAIDHCHKKGHVRGILHDKVNKAIGLFGDDPAALRAAADYLERTADRDFDWRNQ